MTLLLATVVVFLKINVRPKVSKTKWTAQLEEIAIYQPNETIKWCTHSLHTISENCKVSCPDLGVRQSSRRICRGMKDDAAEP
mmetsp:Transcript_88826/g.236480  ORF Transcript_88826/g.236480 Transcript_88826/m.236480 type:complete len:83 (-) Transcript_88826:712-960(-)